MKKNVPSKIKNYELFSGMIGAILGSIIGAIVAILAIYCQQKNFSKDYNTKISLEVIMKFKNSMDNIVYSYTQSIKNVPHIVFFVEKIRWI